MLLVYTDEMLRGRNSRDEWAELVAGHASVKAEMKQKGALITSGALKPTTSATSVRMCDGEVVIFDGPFAETKEQLAGFYVLDCENLDVALEWARKFVAACSHRGDACFEIRPLEDYSYLDVPLTE
jgi:hypothetical protein